MAKTAAKEKNRKMKATGLSTKNRKVVLVPVFLVQNLCQKFERCTCPKSNFTETAIN